MGFSLAVALVSMRLTNTECREECLVFMVVIYMADESKLSVMVVGMTCDIYEDEYDKVLNTINHCTPCLLYFNLRGRKEGGGSQHM